MRTRLFALFAAALLAAAGMLAAPSGSAQAPAQSRQEAAAEIAAQNREVVRLLNAADYGAAEKLARETLRRAEAELGPDHSNTLSSVNNLAFLFEATGRFAEAEPLYRRALAGFERALGPDHPDTLTSVNNLAFLLQATGRYAEAELLYRRALAGYERALGPDHPDTLTSVNNLAALLSTTGRAAEAEHLFRRAVAGRERALGPDHPFTLTSVNNLALLLNATGRFAEAEPLHRRALAGRERALGPDHPDALQSVNNLAALLDDTGRFAEAEPLYRRALGGYERALGPDHPAALTSVNNLAGLLHATGRFAEAEPLHRRALAGRERALGADHPDTLTSVNNLAGLLDKTGRTAEAEPLFRRALAGYERALGPDHSSTLQSVNNLGLLLQATGRFAEAEPLVRRALAGRERALGPDHPDTLASVNNLAFLLNATGRTAEAEPLFRRALAGTERALGPDHPDTLTSVNNLAELLRATGRFAEAEPLHRRALSGRERALGPDHPDALASVNNLALLLQATGRFAEAEPLYRRALAGTERALGADHPNTLTSVNNLALLLQATGRTAEAEPLYRRALAGTERALGPDHPDTLNSLGSYFYGRASGGRALSVPPGALRLLTDRLAASDSALGARRVDPAALANPVSTESRARIALAAYGHALRAGDVSGEDAAFKNTAFRLIQRFQQSAAADALAAAAQRLSLDDAGLRDLLSQRDAKTQALAGKEKALDALRSQPVAERDAGAETVLAQEVDGLRAELRAIAERLAAADSDFAEIAAAGAVDAGAVAARPAERAATRALLKPNEALIVFSAAPENGDLLAFVLRPGKGVAVPLEMGEARLEADVAALRQGLKIPANSALLLDQPFDLARAHALYKDLFAPLEPHLAGATRVFVVPDGALETLPLHLLVSAPPPEKAGGFARYREAKWLGDRYAFVTLPAVSSLAALRKDGGRPAAGDRPLLGFADPLLGAGARPAATQTLAETRDFSALRQLGGQGAATLAGLKPVPQTRALLEQVGAALRAEPRDLYFGPDAQEADLHFLNAQARLGRYRNLAFATHALIAGEAAGTDLIEPAIVLTPPAGAAPPFNNDGLLRASEVVTLKLDADLVILAACNTAAPDGKPGAEALSGLAKAFFYAGARSLLVSHWPAEAGSTAALVPAIAAPKPGHQASRAEALQAAMRAVREDPAREYFAHPALWGPFVLVGEGG